MTGDGKGVWVKPRVLTILFCLSLRQNKRRGGKDENATCHFSFITHSFLYSQNGSGSFFLKNGKGKKVRLFHFIQMWYTSTYD